MSAWLDTWFAVLQRSPLGVWAFLASMVIAWGVMLWIRTWPPGRLSAQGRQFLGHFTGFAVAVLTSWVVWPNRWGLVIGVISGLFGPWSWEVALLVLEWKWPAVAAKLRGVPA